MIIWLSEWREDSCDSNWWFNGPVDIEKIDVSTAEGLLTKTIIEKAYENKSDEIDEDLIREEALRLKVDVERFNIRDYIKETPLPAYVDSWMSFCGDYL